MEERKEVELLISDILKQIKEEKGMTTEALSRLSEVPVGTINKILNGETRSLIGRFRKRCVQN